MKYLLVFIFSLITLEVYSQTAIQSGLLPSVNLNKKLPRDWTINANIESRVYLELTDMALQVSKKIGYEYTLSAGYLLRASAGEFIQRYIQQFTSVRQCNAYRLGHRVASDQTFEAGERPIFRLRYRLAYELPLNGYRVDLKEAYFKMTNEYMYTFNDLSSEVGLRLGPAIGYVVNEATNLEFGFDYRLNAIFTEEVNNRIWVTTRLFLSF